MFDVDAFLVGRARQALLQPQLVNWPQDQCLHSTTVLSSVTTPRVDVVVPGVVSPWARDVIAARQTTPAETLTLANPHGNLGPWGIGQARARKRPKQSIAFSKRGPCSPVSCTDSGQPTQPLGIPPKTDPSSRRAVECLTVDSGGLCGASGLGLFSLEPGTCGGIGR